jgi:rubredoxin
MIDQIEMFPERKKILFAEYDLPTFFASALINGDESGLEEEDAKALALFRADLIKRHIAADCVDLKDNESFQHYHDMNSYGVLACTCATFRFIVERDGAKLPPPQFVCSECNWQGDEDEARPQEVYDDESDGFDVITLDWSCPDCNRNNRTPVKPD